MDGGTGVQGAQGVCECACLWSCLGVLGCLCEDMEGPPPKVPSPARNLSLVKAPLSPRVGLKEKLIYFHSG